MSAREASVRYYKARRAAEEQELSLIEFFHTTSEMVYVSLLGDDDGDISLGIGQARFYMADWDTTEIDLPERAAQLAAIRGIASAIIDAADILEAELYVEPLIADYRAAR